MNTESRIQLERRILAGLCNGTGGPSGRETALARLSNYRWTEAAHRAIFEIMTSFPAMNAGVLREQLPARLTRRGFPEFDFASLLSVPVAAREDMENWVGQLGGINS